MSSVGRVLKLVVDNSREAAKPTEAALEQTLKRSKTLVTDDFGIAVSSTPKSLISRYYGTFPDITIERIATKTGERQIKYSLKTAEGTPIKGGAALLVLEKSPTRRKITLSWLDPEYRNKKIGKRLYTQAILDAEDAGVTITSDSSLSPDAIRLWASLKEAGFAITSNPNATFKNGSLVATKEDWVFKIINKKRRETDDTGQD